MIKTIPIKTQNRLNISVPIATVVLSKSDVARQPISKGGRSAICENCAALLVKTVVFNLFVGAEPQ